MAVVTKSLWPLAHSCGVVIAVRLMERVCKGSRGVPREGQWRKDRERGCLLQESKTVLALSNSGQMACWL